MNETMKPCPFDNSTNLFIEYCLEGTINNNFLKKYRVVCDNCKIKTDNYDTKKLAIEAWNKRADDKYNELVEFLKSHILNGNSCGLTDDMCTKYEDMTFDLQDLLRKHGVEV